MIIEQPNILLQACSTRLPIVLCLDVSPHMRKYADRLNVIFESLLSEISRDRRLNSCAEIALITYSTDLTVSEFKPIFEWKTSTVSISDCGHGDTVKAIMQAVDVIEKRIEALDEMEIGCYFPLLIIATELGEDLLDCTSQCDCERFLRETLAAFNGFDKITACIIDLSGSENITYVNEKIKKQMIILQEDDVKSVAKRIINAFDSLYLGIKNKESIYQIFCEQIVKKQYDHSFERFKTIKTIRK